MRTPILLASLTMVAVVGCSGGASLESSPATSSTPAAAPSASEAAEVPAEAAEIPLEEPIDSEGSVTTEDGSFVLYPDGIRSEIVKVEKMAPTMGNDLEEGHDTEVRVTVRLSNNGQETVPLWPDGSLVYADELYYGENRYPAQAWAGDDEVNAPQQLVPGTSYDVTSIFTMPGSELGRLAFTTNPNSDLYTDYTFTEVETLL